MNRRKFLSRAGFGVISTAAAAQAVAQTSALPEVRWRCASSFPKSLDTIYGGGETIAKRVAAITGGKFQIRVFGAGDIYPALERGTIDAAEWVGPYDDEKLGFYKIAPHYYYPGWWEADSMYSLFVNIKEWEKLPKEYQAAVEAACYEANIDMMAKYDFQNPQALKRLGKNGVKLPAFSPEIMKAAQRAVFKMYEEEAKKNPS